MCLSGSSDRSYKEAPGGCAAQGLGRVMERDGSSSPFDESRPSPLARLEGRRAQLVALLSQTDNLIRMLRDNPGAEHVVIELEKAGI